MPSPSRVVRNELRVLEEHFLDEARFKIESLLSMYTVQKERRREMVSFIHELQRLTKENIALLNRYASK